MFGIVRPFGTKCPELYTMRIDIIIKIAGGIGMITDIKSDDGCYKLTGKTYWPLFGREARVRWGQDTDVSTEYAEKCVLQCQ